MSSHLLSLAVNACFVICNDIQLAKGLTFKMGQPHVQKFIPKLLEQMESGKLNPKLIISLTMRLKDAEEGYKIFDKKEQDSRKAALTP